MTKYDCNSKPITKQGRPPKSTQDFIDKATTKHSGVYGYDLVVYKNGKSKVEIKCSVHGIFLQTPSAHLRGQGCPNCSKLITAKKTTKRQFIKNAEDVHGIGRYDYSKVVYSGNKVKVEVTCNVCNSTFYVKPNNHISNRSGCRSCKYQEAKVTQEDFVRRSIEAHGKDAYNYDKAVYVKGCLKVEIFCNNCNSYFMQSPSSHMAGSKCGNCYLGMTRYTQEEFIEKCHDNYGKNAYDYTNTVYVKSTFDVTVRCKTCGKDFTRSAFSHANGLGCSHCLAEMKGLTRSKFAERCNFNSNGLARLYVVDCNGNNERFYKIVITSHKVSHRLKGKKNLPYDHSVLFEIKGDADYIYNLEIILHRLVKHLRYEPQLFFTGRTECFTTIKPIEKLLKKLSSTEQLQLIA